MEDLKLLKNIPLFTDFKTTELMNVAMVGENIDYKTGQLIFREKTNGDGLYVVKKGRVKITKEDSTGEEHVLAYIGQGEYFGEISLVDRAPRSASTWADEDVKILKIKRKDFKNLITGNAELERKFYKSFSMVLCERLRITNENLTFSQEINTIIQDMENEED